MLRFAATPLLAVAASLSLGGCYYYGDVDGYDTSYDPYYSGYGSANFAYSYFGWYQDYYYPGIGVHVFDRYGNRHRWSDRHRRYWEGRGHRHHDRRENWDGFSRGNDGLYRDQRRRGDHDWREGRREDRRGDSDWREGDRRGDRDWRDGGSRGGGRGDGTGSDRRGDGRGDGTGSGRRGGNGAATGGTSGSATTTQPVAPPIMGNRGNRGRQPSNPVVNPSVPVPQVQTQPRVQPVAPPPTRAPRTGPPPPPPVVVQPAPATQPAPRVERPAPRPVRDSPRVRPNRQDE